MTEHESREALRERIAQAVAAHVWAGVAWDHREMDRDGFRRCADRILAILPVAPAAAGEVIATLETDVVELRATLVTALNMLSTFRDHISTPELLEQDAEEIDAFLRTLPDR